MCHRHAAVWIDHQEAKIFHGDRKNVDAPTLHVTVERCHPADAAHFYGEVAQALVDAEDIFVGGPDMAKFEFIRHIQQHDQPLAQKIARVETVDSPSESELLKYVASYFWYFKPVE